MSGAAAPVFPLLFSPALFHDSAKGASAHEIIILMCEGHKEV
jgi:hypothetical protein